MGIKNMKDTDFRDNETLESFKIHDKNFLLTTLDDIIDWGRSNSVWPLTFATSCCGIEMMAAGASRYDFARFGIEVGKDFKVETGPADRGSYGRDEGYPKCDERCRIVDETLALQDRDNPLRHPQPFRDRRRRHDHRG